MDTKIVSPVELPEGFNRELGVPSRVEDTRVFHTTYMAARFAYALVENGGPEDLKILERAIDTLTQKCQERNPDDPHYGNFRWELEDAAVEDLNAVHFAMIQMIPIMLRFGDRLSDKSREQVLTSTRLFDRTDLGIDAPLQLVERDEELLLEVYNYKGPEKTFWELAYPGSFYKGQPQCAFFAESAERSAHESLKAFSDQVAMGEFVDESDPEPERLNRDKIRAWTLGYARDGKSVGLSVDLLQWQLLRRWNEEGDLGYPLLESSVASQAVGGNIQVDGARLQCGDAKLWLYGNREADLWVAGGIADGATDLILEFPDRSLQVKQFRYGTIKVEAGQVVLDANAEATADGMFRLEAGISADR